MTNDFDERIRKLEKLHKRIKRMSNPAIIDRLLMYIDHDDISNESLAIIDIMGETLFDRLLDSKILQKDIANELAVKTKLFFGVQNINQLSGTLGRIILVMYLANQKARA